MRKPLLAVAGLVSTLALTLSACSASDSESTTSEAGQWPDEITISLVPSTEGEDLALALDPLTEYLSEGLGITVNGVVANDYAATVEALGADQAQVAITDAGSLYNAMEQYDAELILRDERFGATSYAAVAYTNNPDKYCEDEPVMATYAASDMDFAFCNGIEEDGGESTGQGPAAVEALANIEPGTEVAFQGATSPAGYQYPVVAMEDQGVNIDDLTQVPVEGNNNAVLSVLNGDAEVSFGFWDARSSVIEEAPEAATDVVGFAYTEMIPNGGVVATDSLPDDLVEELIQLMADYAESSEQAASVMMDLVGLTDWSPETNEEEIERYGEIYERFAQ